MTPTESLNERVRERLAKIRRHSPRLAKSFQLAYEGRSRPAAIKAKCLDCCGYQPAEVKRCTTVTCPLHKFRPYQSDNAGV